MTTTLQQQRQKAIEASKSGPPQRTRNQFFGVGPITDMVRDEIDGRRQRAAFNRWLENTYRKLDDTGKPVGKFTTSEFNRSMHRGYPADAVLVDMMKQIHSYFSFPTKNKMAVGLGGGHSGFTVCALHFTNTDSNQQIYVDTPKPESTEAASGGFFRQSWGAQLIEMQRHAKNGDEKRLHFSSAEGHIPSADELQSRGITVFFGVGHETTGATTYTETEIRNLLAWVNADPANHHAIIDSTSLLGAMPWSQDVVTEVMNTCCLFSPFQKAIGGVSGYFVISLTPEALELIESNVNNPSWAIPRQLKIAVPENPAKPLSSKITTTLGPIYNPQTHTMSGGIINTYSVLAFAETTFSLKRVEQTIGDVSVVNARSVKNRQAVDEWISKHDIFQLGVENKDSRGAAVTLIKVEDSDITDAQIHATIIARSKQLLGYEGITHPNGDYEPGLDVARYVNAFPGTPGDYRAWVGGIRDKDDIIALLDNIHYAYQRAKVVTLEELLAKDNIVFQTNARDTQPARVDDTTRAYKVLIADLVGLAFDANGNPDYSQVQQYITDKGGEFHNHSQTEHTPQTGKIHFYYLPDLSTEKDILQETQQGQYDAVIAAATHIPPDAQFAHGGVRIGAGTGNMASKSWGGGNGIGGIAPLMNTPGFNSRATAQMAFKALLKVCPGLPVATLHQRVVEKSFDTGKNLCEYPTTKLEGKTIAVIGYGNIGREMALLARAFGMKVRVYARPAHKQWIESEGFIYAKTIAEAAHNADVISVHTGLGAADAAGNFANAGLIDDAVLTQLADGAIVINYDRGEIVDTSALDKALSSGKVCYAAIDADIFVDNDNNQVRGPMAPYLALEKKHQGKLELLPHAAADTEHVSRVEGARQAVDQIFDCIQYQRVTNLKGELPTGYSNNGTQSVTGVGKVLQSHLHNIVCNDADAVSTMRELSESIATFWGAVQAIEDSDERERLVKRYGEQLVYNTNLFSTAARTLGLVGPYGKQN